MIDETQELREKLAEVCGERDLARGDSIVATAERDRSRRDLRRELADHGATRTILFRAILVLEEASRGLHAEIDRECEGVALRELAVKFRAEARLPRADEGTQGDCDATSEYYAQVRNLESISSEARLERFKVDRKRRGVL